MFGERVSRARYKEMLNAAKNRRELIAAQFDRRELIRMGLVTAAGLLAPIKGLSARAQQGIPNLRAPGNQAASPPTTPFTVPLRILPIAQTVAALTPAPTIAPNTAAGEARRSSEIRGTPVKGVGESPEPLNVLPASVSG